MPSITLDLSDTQFQQRQDLATGHGIAAFQPIVLNQLDLG
jgi:hypothetical protein